MLTPLHISIIYIYKHHTETPFMFTIFVSLSRTRSVNVVSIWFFSVSFLL